MEEFYRDNRGITLIELVVVLSLLAIIAGLAYPAVNKWIPNYRLKAASRELYSNLQKAKMEAIKRNRYVAITFNVPISGATYDYIVYVDNNSNLQYDPGETILSRVRLPTSGGISISTNTFINNGNGRKTLAFNPRGLPENAAHNPGVGTITLSNSLNRTHSITISMFGRIRLT